MAIPTLAEVKANLILSGSSDDTMLGSMILSAISYAELRQHRPVGFYNASPTTMSDSTKQAVIMLVTFWYESRDGGTGGFFGDSPSAATSSKAIIDQMLDLDKDWRV